MHAAALLAAGCAVVLAACGSSGATTSSNSHYPYGSPNDPVSTSKCMRANGVPNFPDPVQGPGGGVGLPMVTSSPGTLTVEGITFAGPAFTHAEKLCNEYMPPSGPPPAPTAAQLHQELAVAECMRRNGVPNFPDPGSKGLGKVVTADSGSPAFQRAAKVCGGPGGQIRFSAAG
ncbi:MAG TPA: hypothetical protein VMA77_24710 [Solirubrobacteraceae bacterium]|nr:hypothetical protein [Solirubrobacteraceae bacterium]